MSQAQTHCISGAQPNLPYNKVVVHPLVLLSVVDHYNRVSNVRSVPRVMGILLGGLRADKTLDVANSYAVPFDEDQDDPSTFFLDAEYLETMFGMFYKVAAKEKIVGWYHTGPRLCKNDIAINEVIKRFHPNPVLVVIQAQPTELGLPTNAYIEVEEDGTAPIKTFEHLASEIGAEEAEEVGVEHLLRDIKDQTAGTLSQRITNLLRGLRGFESNLAGVMSYIQRVIRKELPLNYPIIHSIQEMLNLLPNVAAPEFVEAHTVQMNDQQMCVYLGTLVRTIIALHNLIDNKLLDLLKLLLKMGKKEAAPILAHCSIPAYCLRSVNEHHLLIAGGGGSAKTGVKNEIQLHLLGFDGESQSQMALKAFKTTTLDTQELASMNMDVSCFSENDDDFLFAVGQDKYCTLYITQGFCVSEESENPKFRLSFNFIELGSINTERRSMNPYQTCVRLYKLPRGLFMATGGTDGIVRLWPMSDILEIVYAENEAERPDNGRQLEPAPLIDVEPLRELNAGGGGDIEQIDVSKCGQYLASVAKETIIWDTTTGLKLAHLPSDREPFDAKFKNRSIRFVNLARLSGNLIFVTAHNLRQKTSSKQQSFLSSWAFSSDQRLFHLISSREIRKENISSLEVNDFDANSASTCQSYRSYTAIGTNDGSVGVYDTMNSLTPVYFVSGAHSSFVTALTFLPQRVFIQNPLPSSDEANSDDNAYANRVPIPGICAADSQTAVISLSVDTTIRLHKVPLPSTRTLTDRLLWLAIWATLFYLIVWYALDGKSALFSA